MKKRTAQAVAVKKAMAVKRGFRGPEQNDPVKNGETLVQDIRTCASPHVQT